MEVPSSLTGDADALRCHQALKALGCDSMIHVYGCVLRCIGVNDPKNTVCIPCTDCTHPPKIHCVHCVRIVRTLQNTCAHRKHYTADVWIIKRL